MPIFQLSEEPIFPPAQLADDQGIIAIGGDLSPERVLVAYASGIFPWFSKGDPIIWWSPDPRLILQPGDLHVSQSMKKLIKQKRYHITMDKNFLHVIRQCAAPRSYQKETWITSDMQKAYKKLHDLGFAHSLEIWEKNTANTPTETKRQKAELVGGLYGISLGKCFFGESMFSRKSNVSKLAFITLAQTLFQAGFEMIDCQLPTDHLKSMGAKEVSRDTYLSLLEAHLTFPTVRGKWQFQLLSESGE